MTPPPEQRELVEQWLVRAQEDLHVAEYLLQREDNCPLATICFHTQQSVEKYLKALLVGESIPFGKTHDLLELRNLTPDVISAVLPTAELALLNRYAVEMRYPGRWEVITREEASSAVATAQSIQAVITKALFRITDQR